MHEEFFQLLTKDHNEVKDILEQLERTDGSGNEMRTKLFEKLRSELVPHLKAEEAAYYPILLEKDQSREKAMEAEEEHHASDLILHELEKLDTKNERWGAKLNVFKEMVEHHIQEEQEEVFKVTREALNEGEIQRIMENFKKEKENLKRQFQ